MIRKFNFTDRIKIPRENVDASIKKVGSRYFLNFVIRKGNLVLPDDAKIFVDASYGPDVIRFDYGEVGRFSPPKNPELSELMKISETIYLEVKVVSSADSSGRLVAELRINDLVGNNEKNRGISLLHVNLIEMDTGEIWRLKLDLGEDMPLLEVNKEIEGIKEITKSDPLFVSLIYPSAVRRILEFVLFDQRDFDSISESWQSRWLRFGCSISGGAGPTAEMSEEDLGIWISDVVRAFTNKNRTLEMFKQKIST
jgi:hypothetical protein